MKKTKNPQRKAQLAKKRHAKNLARKDKTYNPDSAMQIAYARALEKREQQNKTADVGDTIFIS